MTCFVHKFHTKTNHASDLMKHRGIHHFSTRGDIKASVVERFNRTLKQRLYRCLSLLPKNTLNFVPALHDLMQEYNRSYHRNIKMDPEKSKCAQLRPSACGRICTPNVWNRNALNPSWRWGIASDNRKYRVFKKRYLPGRTEEVFLVARVMRGVVPS